MIPPVFWPASSIDAANWAIRRFPHLIRIQLAAEAEPDVERPRTWLAARLTTPFPPERKCSARPRCSGTKPLLPPPLVRSTTRAESIAAVHSTIEELLADKSLRKITLAIDVDPQ